MTFPEAESANWIFQESPSSVSMTARYARRRDARSVSGLGSPRKRLQAPRPFLGRDRGFIPRLSGGGVNPFAPTVAGSAKRERRTAAMMGPAPIVDPAPDLQWVFIAP